MVARLARAQAPGRGADQQPERRGHRLALHAAVLRHQHHGRPERAWRDHRRAARPQDPRRGRRAGDRHRRQAPAAAVRDHHRRLRPPQHLLRAPRLLDQGAGGRAAGRQLVRLHRGGRRGRRLDRPARSGARPTRTSASRSRRTISRARPRRRSRCRAPRTPSGACTSTSGPSRPSAGSTWPPGTPAMLRSISSSCAGGPASAGSTSRPRPTSPRSPGCSRPTTTTASGTCCRATSCPRTTCASAPSATACPTTSGPRQGFIEATPGNVVDYGAIEQRIRADAALFQVKEIAYDPWNATHIALRLQDEGATMVEFRQGFRSMAAPTRELEKLIVSRKLAHGGNPVTRWMAANVAVAQDPAGNLKPAKDKSHRAHRRHRRRSSWPSAAPCCPGARVSYQLLILGPHRQGLRPGQPAPIPRHGASTWLDGCQPHRHGRATPSRRSTSSSPAGSCCTCSRTRCRSAPGRGC